MLRQNAWGFNLHTGQLRRASKGQGYPGWQRGLPPDGYITGMSLETHSLPNGYFALPSEPGLGIELDDDALQAKLFDGAFDLPGPGNLFKLPDGSAAEW